jgi:O-antigen/teichoic acid export membrane protein
VSTPETTTTRGALVGIATVVVERAVAFVVVLVLARTLAPETFGRYGYVLAGMTLVQVIADQGIEVAAVAAMAASRSAISEIFGAVFLLRLLVWAVFALPVGALVLPALAASGDGASLAPAGAAASLLVLVGTSISMRGMLRARGAMTAMAVVALADALVGGVAILGAARAGASLATLFAVRAAGSLAVTAGALTLGPERPDFAEGRRALRRLAGVAAPLGGNAVLVGLQTRAGHLVAMSLAGPVVVGLLGAASRMTEALGVVPEGALLALFPRMAADGEQAPALAATAARRLAAVVLPFVVILTVGAEAIVALLFGDAYAGAAPAIVVLAWIAPFVVTGNVAFHAIVARGAERMLLPANLIAALVGIGLQIVLIRALGLQGAALATVGTAAVGQLALLAREPTRGIVAGVWRAVGPLALLGLVVVSLVRWASPTLPGAIAAAAIHTAMAGALGLVDRDDWRSVRAGLAGPRIG